METTMKTNLTALAVGIAMLARSQTRWDREGEI